MRELYLIDGTYELFRAFFGPPPRQTPAGREVGALHGLLRSLLSLRARWRREGVEHGLIAFDTVIESFRNELFPGYKTGAAIDPLLWGQAADAERAAAAIGIPVASMIEFEADDALASAAFQFAHEFERVVIATPDKDLAQCVIGTRVVMWDRKQDKWIDEDAVLTKFGVPPKSIPDWLALVGDSADGIPGLAGFGEKGAATLLRAYPHIDDIPRDPKTWSIKVRGAETLSRTLEANRDTALLYRKLATLRMDVPLGSAPKLQPANVAELDLLARELDFPQLLELTEKSLA